MARYIALLRGVNVGGKSKLSMSMLKDTFICAGFSEVSTYINSGNIIFSDDCESVVEVKRKCENIIADKFGMKITVAVINSVDYKAALANAPDWWGIDTESKHNAIFVIPPFSAQELVKQVGETKPEYEKSAVYGQVIFWSAPIKTFSHTRWANVVSTALYQNVTIRNANTAKKLVGLL